MEKGSVRLSVTFIHWFIFADRVGKQCFLVDPLLIPTVSVSIPCRITFSIFGIVTADYLLLVIFFAHFGNDVTVNLLSFSYRISIPRMLGEIQTTESRCEQIDATTDTRINEEEVNSSTIEDEALLKLRVICLTEKCDYCRIRATPTRITKSIICITASAT